MVKKIFSNLLQNFNVKFGLTEVEEYDETVQKKIL